MHARYPGCSGLESAGEPPRHRVSAVETSEPPLSAARILRRTAPASSVMPGRVFEDRPENAEDVMSSAVFSYRKTRRVGYGPSAATTYRICLMRI